MFHVHYGRGGARRHSPLTHWPAAASNQKNAKRAQPAQHPVFRQQSVARTTHEQLQLQSKRATHLATPPNVELVLDDSSTALSAMARIVITQSNLCHADLMKSTALLAAIRRKISHVHTCHVAPKQLLVGNEAVSQCRRSHNKTIIALQPLQWKMPPTLRQSQYRKRGVDLHRTT